MAFRGEDPIHYIIEACGAADMARMWAPGPPARVREGEGLGLGLTSGYTTTSIHPRRRRPTSLDTVSSHEVEDKVPVAVAAHVHVHVDALNLLLHYQSSHNAIIPGRVNSASMCSTASLFLSAVLHALVRRLNMQSAGVSQSTS